MLSLYHGIFHSHLQYGILAWSATYKSYYNKIAILQNKAVKIIRGGKWNGASISLNLMISSILKKHAFYLNINSTNFPAYSTITLILQVILMKNTREAVAVTITFCPFIEIRNYRDQLNIKALRHGIHWNLL